MAPESAVDSLPHRYRMRLDIPQHLLRQSDLRGYITDPPAACRSYDLSFDLSKALAKYCRIVLDTAAALPSRETGQVARYQLTENRELFVDRKLLKLLQGLESGLVSGQDVLVLLERRAGRYVARAGSRRSPPNWRLGLTASGSRARARVSTIGWERPRRSACDSPGVRRASFGSPRASVCLTPPAPAAGPARRGMLRRARYRRRRSRFRGRSCNGCAHRHGSRSTGSRRTRASRS